MSIRKKLFALVGINAASLFLIAGVYIFFNIPINVLENERLVITELKDSALLLQIEGGRFTSAGIGSQKKIFRSALDLFYAKCDKLPSLKLLPRLNAKMAAAMKNVSNLRALADSGVSGMNDALDTIERRAIEVYGSANTSTLMNLQSYENPDDAYQTSTVKLDVFSFQRKLTDFQTVISTVNDTLADKEALVIANINAARTRASFATVIVIILSAASALAFSSIIARSISKSFAGLEKGIELMTSGDLSQSFGLSGNDEIGKLGLMLDNLLEALNSSLARAKRGSRQNIAIREELSAAVSEAESSAVEIKANSESIGKRMRAMNDTIHQVSGIVNEAAAGAGTLKTRVSEQDADIAKSTGEVQSIIEGVDAISRLSANDRESAGELERKADEGRDIFEEAFEKMAAIGDSVTLIREMTESIATIASQTNVLALNAAIEAAHAGEFGKGFAVVADEIAKLATASAESSSEISQTIARVSGLIEDATSTRELTSGAFDDIIARIGEVTRSVTEIARTVDSIRDGGSSTLAAMDRIRKGSVEISGESRRIDAAMATVARSFAELGNLSSEVASNIGEISQGLEDIESSVAKVSEHSARVGAIGDELVESVEVFRTRED